MYYIDMRIIEKLFEVIGVILFYFRCTKTRDFMSYKQKTNIYHERLTSEWLTQTYCTSELERCVVIGRQAS